MPCLHSAPAGLAPPRQESRCESAPDIVAHQPFTCPVPSHGMFLPPVAEAPGRDASSTAHSPTPHVSTSCPSGVLNAALVLSMRCHLTRQASRRSDRDVHGWAAAAAASGVFSEVHTRPFCLSESSLQLPTRCLPCFDTGHRSRVLRRAPAKREPGSDSTCRPRRR